MAKLTLRTPFIDLFKVERTELNLRETLYGFDIIDSRKHSSDMLEQVYFRCAKIAGLDFKDVLQMDVRDIEALIDHLNKIQEVAEPAPKDGTVSTPQSD